jgi:RluA family pseudouridine synthase
MLSHSANLYIAPHCTIGKAIPLNIGYCFPMLAKSYDLLFQDDALVAINKPARLAVLPGRGRTESLVELLTADPRLKGAKPLIVHRLDADTSGVIVFALTEAAHRALSEQFRLRTVTKEYWALVRGTPLHESGSVNLPIGGDPGNKNRMVIRGLEPKKSRTNWVMKDRFKGVSLLAVFPVTGRRHQIRVHLKAMGHPLAVDPYYGGESLLLSEFKRKYKLGKHQEERPLMERLTLHARSLSFAHPTSGEPMTISAELPKDFRSALAALEKWAR